MWKALAAVPRLVDMRSESIVLMTEHESTLSRLVQEVAEPKDTAVYIGYRDGIPRPTIWGFDQRGKARIIAKYASGARERHALHKEYQTLRSLNERPHLVGRVPVPLSFEDGHLGSILVTDAFDGVSGPFVPDVAVEQWLQDCIVGPDLVAGTSSLFQTLKQQASSRGGVALEAFAPAYESLEHAIVPTTIVHGDFTPWNLFVDAEMVKVFDWETAAEDGIPEWDRVFYIFRAGLMAQSWNSDRLSKEVRLLAGQGSNFYDAYQWKALLTLSLVHLLVNQPPFGNGMDILERALREVIQSWWT